MENTIQSDLIRGHINTIILKALFDGDRYGYDIVREIEQKSSGQYKLKQPTLYSCLKRLEIQGFIRSYWGAKSNGGRRKYFTLTDLGRELFIKNQSEWEYSRTVIDKLISDREVDLSKMPAATVEPQEQTAEEFSENSDNEDINEDEELYSEEDEQEESELVDKDEDELEAYEQQDEEREILSPEKVREHESKTEYTNTFDIMTELLKENESGSESYTHKIRSDKYVSERTDSGISSQNYFRDYFYPPEEEKELQEDSEQENALQNEQSVITHNDQTQEQNADEANQKVTFFNYHTSYVTPAYNSIIEREYRNILGEFINPSFVDPAPKQTPASEPVSADSPAPTPQTEEATDEYDEEYEKLYNEAFNKEYAGSEGLYEEQNDKNVENYTDDAGVNKKLNKLTADVRKMGDNVTIRKHNSASAKEFNSAHYYYSNKLLLIQYGILFGIMALEIIFSAIFVNVILSAGQRSDRWVYPVAVIVAAAFPVYAAIRCFTAPDNKKRLDFNLKNSLVYRIIVLAQCFIIIYCLNIIAGMPISFSNEYLSTIILPTLLCTNFPVNSLVFNTLIKTRKFSVAQ